MLAIPIAAALWLLGSCAVDAEPHEGLEQRAFPILAGEDVANAKEIWRPPHGARCGLAVGGIELVSIRAGEEWLYFEIRHEPTSSADALGQEAVVPKAEVNAHKKKHTAGVVAGALAPGAASWVGLSKAALGAELKGPGQVEVSLSAWGGEVTARLSASASGEWAYAALADRDDVRIDEHGVGVLDISGLNVVVGP
ncbi:MAG: hypothetical protein HYZ29_14680 [Myxococcales bacterium]|nr:hypothetical protein [Myxococcales bacterium]